LFLKYIQQKQLSLIAQKNHQIKIRNSNIEIRNKPGSNKSKSRKSKTSNPIWTRLEFAVFEWF